jgi:CheY-like chemotaxis protein
MSSSEPADPGEADADPFCVLVVDDEPIIRDLLRVMLKNMGVCAEVAENGVAAQRKVLAGSYQMVITDINMPEMDGIAFVKWLRKRKPEIEIAMMTGNDIDDDTLETIGNTASTCFVKPPEQMKVRALVQLCRDKFGRRS